MKNRQKTFRKPETLGKTWEKPEKPVKLGQVQTKENFGKKKSKKKNCC